MLFGTAGCGIFVGTSQQSTESPDGQVEKSTITIGVDPSIGMAPLYVARDQGYFAEEGLDVKIVTLTGSGENLDRLLAGDVDLTFANYPAIVRAQQKAAGKAEVKIVADAVAAKPDSSAVVVNKDSPYRNPDDLEDKTIGVPARGGIAELAVKSGMRAARADPSGVDWQVMRFADMLPKLQGGEIDAAYLEEPYLTVAQAQLGVWTVFQPMVGRLDGIGLSGYAALEKTTQAYPNTVAAFQRAVLKVHRSATTPEGQKALNGALISKLHIDPEIAAVLHLPAYPLTADPTRLQRVPDLMREYGIIKKAFDIRPMILQGKS
jgi:NitT/TauT family transport system substrate-binding protein